MDDQVSISIARFFLAIQMGFLVKYQTLSVMPETCSYLVNLLVHRFESPKSKRKLHGEEITEFEDSGNVHLIDGSRIFRSRSMFRSASFSTSISEVRNAEM